MWKYLRWLTEILAASPDLILYSLNSLLMLHFVNNYCKITRNFFMNRMPQLLELVFLIVVYFYFLRSLISLFRPARHFLHFHTVIHAKRLYSKVYIARCVDIKSITSVFKVLQISASLVAKLKCWSKWTCFCVI